MIRYIKWFLLVILIICLVIIGVKFINYDKYEFNMSDIYEFNWYKRGVAIYENGELFSENQKLTGIHYMTFTEDKVTYCDSLTKECEEYSYSYKHGKITINSEEEFLPKGTYNINLKDDVLELGIQDGKSEIIYYFRSPVG